MKSSCLNNNLTLEAVQQEFEAWRASRKGREKIPQALWEAAVQLSDRHSLSRVSRALRLSFGELKKRRNPLEANPMEFTELDLGNLQGSWQIECQRPDGSRLKVSGFGPVPGLGPLLGEFWR